MTYNSKTSIMFLITDLESKSIWIETRILKEDLDG